MSLNLAQTYNVMHQQMNGITEKGGYFEWILWMNICELVIASEVIEKDGVIKAMAYEMDRLWDWGIGILQTMCHQKTAADYDEYLYMVQEYAFSPSYDEMGDCWKKLLGNEKLMQIEELSQWLEYFQKQMLPALYQIITDWDYSNHPKTPEEIREGNKKVYNAFRRKIDGCRKSLDQAAALYRMKRHYGFSR